MSDVKSQPNRLTLYGRKLFRPILISTAMLFIIVFILNQSQEFSHCIHNGKNAEEYESLKERDGVFVQPPKIYWLRLRLYTGCVGHFTDKNEGALVAIATIALSIFTYTLWRATARLGELATAQSRDMQDMLAAARNNAVAAASHAQISAQQHITIQKQARATADVAAAAARSADIAERALTELERPFLLPSLQPSTFEARRKYRHLVFLRYEFCNYGRTPAIVTHRRVECIIVKPPLDIIAIREADKITPFVLAPGERRQWQHSDLPKIHFPENGFPATDKNFISLYPELSGGDVMYFFVLLRYRSIFQKSHDTWRFWQYNGIVGFCPLDGDGYDRTT